MEPRPLAGHAGDGRALGGVGLRAGSVGVPGGVLRARLEHRVDEGLGEEPILHVAALSVAQELDEGRRRDGGPLDGRADPVELGVALDEQVAAVGDGPGGPRAGRAEGDGGAGEAGEDREDRVDRGRVRGCGVPEVDREEGLAGQRRAVLGRERGAEPVDRLRQVADGGYDAPPSSWRSTRRSSLPVSL